MRRSTVICLILFGLLLLIPLLARSSDDGINAIDPAGGDIPTLIILSPHNEQIRSEFGAAFSRWHDQQFGTPVRVIWNTPGGTSEIRRMLIAQYEAALRDDRPVGGAADLLFGGGSYEFNQLKQPITFSAAGAQRSTTILEPVAFHQRWLREMYGENTIGGEPLYDPELYWFGAALSSFGIVYNRNVLREIGLDEPEVWTDLAHPALRGWIGLVNPGQSGSITTAFDIILQRMGWNEGWQTLRRAAANSRYFASSASKPPLDVSQGDAAMGICIDFYGRYQAQAIQDGGGGDRVGYVDPPGLSTIDADPVAMLRGRPSAREHPDLAAYFIRFVLSVEGQALWQFAAHEGEGLGPREFELRRLPVRRAMYEQPYFDRLIDRVNPFEMNTPIEQPIPASRSFVTVLFQAMAMDSHHELKDAWRAIVEHPVYPRDPKAGIVTSADIDDPALREMLELFDALPAAPAPNDGSVPLGDVARLDEVKAGWLRGGWEDQGLWHEAANPSDVLRRRFGEFFRGNYRRIVELAKNADST